MTGRVCPVHGEYAADGVCRWCEPAPAKPMHPDVPKGSTPCYCGKYAWAPWCREERNTVIAGVAHSPEQCFKLNAGPPAVDAYADMLGPSPKPLPPGYDWTRGPEVDTPEKLACIANVDEAPKLTRPILESMLEAWTVIEKTDEAYGWRLEWAAPVPPGPELNADKERRLAEEHAALRWERVARRRANKHGPWTLLDFAQHWQFFLNKLIALQFKRIAEIGHPLLPVPPKEPKP